MFVTISKRSALAPDIPPASETIPGYALTNWFGGDGSARHASQGDCSIGERLIKIIRTPDTRQKLLDGGFGILEASSTKFAAIVRGDMAKYAKVIREAQIQVDF